MEEHLRTEEAFVANVNLKGFSSDNRLVCVFLELVGLQDVATLIHGLLIELTVFLDHILADIAVLLLYFLGDVHSVMRWDLLSSVSHML